MKTSTSILVRSGILALCVGMSVPASASYDVPAPCQDPELNEQGRQSAHSAFKTGKILGRSLVEHSWDKAEGCEGLGKYAKGLRNIMDRFAPMEVDSTDLLCRLTGVNRGMTAALEAIEEKCGQPCAATGGLAGYFAATMYCELSAASQEGAVDWNFLQAPARVCGLNFQNNCEETFARETAVYTNSEGLRCTPYTRGKFDKAWQQAQYQQCDFLRGIAWMVSQSEPASEQVGLGLGAEED